METLVNVEGLWKRYARDLKASIRYAAGELWRSTVGIETPCGELRKSEFWALQDVGFDLRRGQVLAIMGHNGAGKSTLLKCIAGKLKADRGRIEVRGQLGHLIEMSAGFVPTLTGRENVRMRGRLLGVQGAALNRYVDAVAEFAEIDEFFDAPVQFYSSGMRSRLGFATSSMMEPDVLILDEVLAVGDLGFRLRCYERINEVARKAAVLYVSHSLGQIARMCNRALFLEKGRVIYQGDVQQAVALYQDRLGAYAAKKKAHALNPELVSLALLVDGLPWTPENLIEYGATLAVQMEISRLPRHVQLRVLLKDASSGLLMDWNSIRGGIDWSAATGMLVVELGSVELNPGTYAISVVALSSDGLEILCLSEPVSFRAGGDLAFENPIQRRARWRFVA